MTQPQAEPTGFDINEIVPDPVLPPEEKTSRVKRFLAHPHLPKGLVLTVVLLILTNIFVTLINQPTIYWIDYETAMATSPILREVLIISPFLFVGGAVVYVILVWLALAFLPRFGALVIWMVLSFIHLRDVIWWADCGLKGIYYNESNNGVCQATDFTLAIIGSAILGLVLANSWFRVKPLLSANVETAPNETPKLSKTSVFISFVWVVFLSIVLAMATNIPATGWQPIVVKDAPAPRVNAEVVFDSNRGKAVLFGGATGWLGEDQWIMEDDTWEWDGTTWEQKFSETNPSPRISYAMAYDEKRGVTVLFGGDSSQGSLNDTWEWNGEWWVEQFPQTSPPLRCCHHMYYDSEFGTVRVFGGYDGDQTFYNDVWEWDGSEWHQVIFDTPSPVASGFGQAYDRDKHQLVTFLSGFPEGTWLLQENRWSDPQLKTEPTPRTNAAMEYDRRLGKILLFGGSKDNWYLNDTWVLDGEWSKYDSPLNPTPRWGHNLFYDTNQERVVMFGGFDGTNYLNEMWMFVPEE